MTQTNNSQTQPNESASLVKPMLLGAGIALIVILVFVLPIKHARAEWGQFWMIRPLIITPLAGAVGGACYYFINRFFNRAGWPKGGAVLLSLLVYLFGLWMGIVLGLAGTLWN